MKVIKYFVNYDNPFALNDTAYDTAAQAIGVAKQDLSDNPEVYQIEYEYDKDGHCISQGKPMTIWTANDVDDPFLDVDAQEKALANAENAFKQEYPKSDIEDIPDDIWDIPEDEDTTPADWDDPNRFAKNEDLNIKEAVDALEENESEVECKNCFDLFPKEECVKTEKGYLCKKCNQELHSHQGTNLDLIDKDPFDLDYDDPRLPEEKEEAEIKEEPVDADEMRKHEKGIDEQLEKEITTEWDVFNHYVKNWLDCDVDNDMLELAFERGLKGKDLPSKWYDAAWLKWDDLDYLESINETGKDIKSKGLQAVIQDIAEAESETGDPQDIQNLEEHINDRPADIESDQELQGIDNAVIDCKKYTLVAHSEDEKPVDCKLEKPALEEPLAGKEVDGKFYEDLSEKEIKELDKEVETLKEELKVITDFSEYKPWSGAVDTYELIEDAGKLDDLEAYLEELYPDGITATQINDILWFDGDQVLHDLGLGDVEDEEVDESLKEAKKSISYGIEYGDEYNEDFEEEYFDTLEDAEEAYDEKLAWMQEEDTGYVYINLFKQIGDPEDGNYKFLKQCHFDEDEGDWIYESLKEDANEALTSAQYIELANNLSKLYQEKSGIWQKAMAKLIYKYGYNNCITAIKKSGVIEDEDLISELSKAVFELADDIRDGVFGNLKEDVNEKPWIMQQGEDGEPEYLGFAKSQNDMIDKMVKDHRSDSVYENTYIDELDKDTYEYMKKDGDLSEDEIKELDKYFGLAENLEEAKKDDELPVDPEAAKLEVHTMLNDLVADEIEAINGYEEAKKEILDAPISHKDNILDTVDHIEDEEKEHVDELISATTEIPFDKEEAPAPAVEEPVVEEPAIEEEPLNQEFPEVEENLNEAKSGKYTVLDRQTYFDSFTKVADFDTLDAAEDFVEQNCSSSFWWRIMQGDKIVKEPEELEEDITDLDDPFAITEEDVEYLNTEAPGLDDENDERLLHELTLGEAFAAAKHWYEANKDPFWARVAKVLEDKIKEAGDKALIDSFELVDNKLVINCKQLTEAKEPGDKEKSYSDGLKLAKLHNKPVIYGYSNKSYGGKFFALDNPIICDSVSDETKKFKAQYKSCGTVYVAYPGDFEESLKEELDPKETQFVFTPEEQAEYNCDEEGNCEDSYDQLCHCGWCGDVFPTSEMRHEADFGWICSRCEDELKYHGGPLTFIENEDLEQKHDEEKWAITIDGEQKFIGTESEMKDKMSELEKTDAVVAHKVELVKGADVLVKDKE